MSVILAATWNPRGEEERFRNLMGTLSETYSGIVIVFPPQVNRQLLERLNQWLVEARIQGSLLVTSPEWSMGRFLALKKSLEFSGDTIHYADFDRLLRWIETRLEEWRETVRAIEGTDCLIIGRQPQAYATHPQALIQTEAISNTVSSYYLGSTVDISAGSKGFSRRAVEFLVKFGTQDQPFGTDAEWPILLRRAGYRVKSVLVAGLDWESADRFQAQAAGPEQQAQAANLYDADSNHWASRTRIAMEIVQAALDSARRPIQQQFPGDFDFTAVFDVDDYMYFYQQNLTPEITQRQVDFLIKELELTREMKILDLACGFGRHSNRLALQGFQVTGIDLFPGFLELARKEAGELGVAVDYQTGDMRTIDFDCQFDRVLLLFTAFGYFSDDENLQVICNIARALKPGGRLIFDIKNRDSFLKGFIPCFVIEKDGNFMIDRLSFDSLAGRQNNQRVVIRDGLRRDKPFSVRLFNATEIQTLLSEAGLRTAHILGGWDGSPFTAESLRMVIIAEKVINAIGEEE